MSIHAEAEITLDGGIPLTVSGDLVVPSDDDGDGLANAWESLYGDLNPDADSDLLNGGGTGDGLTVFEEYRGQYGFELLDNFNPVSPTGTYVNGHYLPAGAYGHTRLNPERPTLFVKYGNFDASYPFALGEALNEANIEVFVYDLGSASAVPGEMHIDVVTMTLRDSSFGFEDGRVYKRSGIRDFSYSTLGNCGLGDGETYGGNCFLFKPALTNLFGDRMYRDGDALGPDPNDNNQLDSPSLDATEDNNDNAVDDAARARTSRGMRDTSLDGDFYILRRHRPRLDAVRY